jgi:hypothetical protein
MRRAALLRRRGLTLKEIGRHLGITRQAAHLLVRAYDRRKGKLTVEQVLAWADAYHGRYGGWPTASTGRLRGGHGLTWQAVNLALDRGMRGLPGGSSLAQLLAERRGVRNYQGLPAFTERQILAWADGHHRRAGGWPTHRSGPIPEAPGETWLRVDTALREGLRGLAGSSSLARLLFAKRGVRKSRGRLRGTQHTERRIRISAAAHRRRTGRWPTADTGPVLDAPGETWGAIDLALVRGRRGLAGGTSLSRLLQPYRCRCLPANGPTS